jgi:PAS domain S-box-containing protein
MLGQGGMFSTDGFMPHGMCYLWRPGILALHVVSDSLIALAYFSIPFTLIYFVRKRSDLRFGWIFVSFAAFIIACGASHFMEIWTIWHPTYWLSGGVKAVTALASVPTAILLVKLVPTALRVPNPSALEAANAELAREVAERRAAETQVRQLNESLEARIAERTAELTAANQVLRAEMQVRKQSDERADEAQQRMAALVESADDAIIIKDLAGVIRSWNAGAERLLHYRADEIIGQPITQLLPDDRKEEESLILSKIREGQAVAHFETVRRRKSGSLVDVSLTISPIRDGSGAIVGASKIMRDITERKQYVEQLRTLNDELERRILARNAELRERDALLQEIHHRVKNNLQVISSLINMQVRTLRDDTTRDALQQCRSRVETMAQIHEMLYQSKDYSNVPFGKYAKELVTRVLSASGLSPDGVTIHYEMQNLSLPVDKAIPCALILNELISNALKHAFPKGAGTIRIELRLLPAERVLLCISDDGVGIPTDFDPARSASLGMQLVVTLAEQLDGRLEIDRGPGAVFRLTFPSGDSNDGNPHTS